MATLFAPQVRAIQPAFIYNYDDKKGEVIIYFSLSPYNNENDYDKIGYTIIDPNQASTWGTNSMIKQDEYLVAGAYDKIESGEYYFPINLLSNEFKTFSINQFYQVQLWLIKDDLKSELSQPTLIRPIAEPKIEIDGNDGQKIYKLTHLTGRLVTAAEEPLDSCYGEIYNDRTGEGYFTNTVYSDDGVNFSIPLDPNIIQEGDGCSGKLFYTTAHGYSGESHINSVTYASPFVDSAFTLSITKALTSSSFKIETKNTTGWKTGALERKSDKPGEEYWQNVGAFDGSYEDFTVESNINYIYRVISEDKSSCSAATEPAQVQFEDIYLNGQDGMLIVRYNPNISNFKYVVQESITNSLGGKYPIIRSNGNTKYRQFTLSGLIYSQALVSTTDNEYVNDSKNMAFAWPSNDEPATWYAIESKKSSSQMVAEKLARQEIMEFLTDQKPKLFRSFEEGNMIVYLSGVSFTPNKTLGRHIYDFSATVTEICEYTSENLIKYGLNQNNYHPAIMLSLK